jgi:hypothetical protein
MQRPSLMAWPGSWLTSVIRSLVCVADSTSIVKVQYGDLVPPRFLRKNGVSVIWITERVHANPGYAVGRVRKCDIVETVTTCRRFALSTHLRYTYFNTVGAHSRTCCVSRLI